MTTFTVSPDDRWAIKGQRQLAQGSRHEHLLLPEAGQLGLRTRAEVDQKGTLHCPRIPPSIASESRELFEYIQADSAESNFSSHLFLFNLWLNSYMASTPHTSLKNDKTRSIPPTKLKLYSTFPQVDIFAHDLVLVPVHLGMHWCLAVIDFKGRAVRYYDSMGGGPGRCIRWLGGYLNYKMANE